MIRGLYRLAASSCAELVWRVPSLESVFTGLGPRLWDRPGFGRFYRSAADRLAARLHRSGSKFRQVQIDDISLSVDVTEFTTKWLYFGRAMYEPATTACVRRLLPAGGVFVDVGANHGYFSLIAAAVVGAGGRVVSFEPNPSVFEQLTTHVRLNGFEERVTCLPRALADVAEGELRLFRSQIASNSGLSSLTPSPELLRTGGLSEADTVPVPVTTFDYWFATSGLDHVDLLKIDVEGAELEVLRGMSASLAAGLVDAIVLETSSDGPAHRLLCEAGFKAQRLESVGGLANTLFTAPHRVSPNGR